MEQVATRQDITDVRSEMARMWADVRDAANRHADDDIRRFDHVDERFQQVTEQIESLNRTLSEWTGSLRLLKGIGGICLPLILGGVAAHVIRHWNG